MNYVISTACFRLKMKNHATHRLTLVSLLDAKQDFNVFLVNPTVACVIYWSALVSKKSRRLSWIFYLIYTISTRLNACGSYNLLVAFASRLLHIAHHNTGAQVCAHIAATLSSLNRAEPHGFGFCACRRSGHFSGPACDSVRGYSNILVSSNPCTLNNQNVC